MLGSNLKSRLQEAFSISHLAAASRLWAQGLRTSAPGRAGAEQLAQHSAYPGPGWARRYPFLCRGLQAGPRSCSFSFFHQLAGHWPFTLLHLLWFCPGYTGTALVPISSREMGPLVSGFIISIIHKKCKFIWFWWNNSNFKADFATRGSFPRTLSTNQFTTASFIVIT